MSGWSIGRSVGLAGALAGLSATGAAVGLAAERYVVGRSLRADDPYADEPFGSLRGTPYVVEAADGAELHVEIDEPKRWPPGPRLTVVLSHGYCLNQDSWHFQRRDLRDQARLVCWDQRSHGRSGKSQADTPSIELLGDDLARVMEAVAPTGPVVLVGHSMGGMATLSYLAQRPEVVGPRVVGVGLVCTSAGGMDAVTLGVPGRLGRWVHTGAPAALAVLSRQPDLVERSRQAGSDLGFVLTKRYSFGRGAPASIVTLTAEMIASTPIDVVADFFPIFDDYDGASALALLQDTPVTVVSAELDLLTPVEHGRDIANAIPRARYLELTGTGHVAMLEFHPRVTAALIELLGRVRVGLAGADDGHAAQGQART